jgi:tetratricopeptide (TPR) repeat protein
MTQLSGGAASRSSAAQGLVFAVALTAAVLLAYRPAWHGSFLWDDDGHVTRADLRSTQGLQRIWFDIGATQQYYPLLHSFFWLQHKLWGEATTGYHLTGILLHVAASLLAALLLRRLGIPGAWLAAAIFALHPVHVESVAWIAEQKNTLSAALCLGSALVYLRFDRARRAAPYLGALLLFTLALLSKSVTATLPATLLAALWWQRGRLSWRRDVLPLAPFFVLGALAGLLTIWVEREFIGAKGAAFEFGLPERFLLAGRALWFYLGKLAWPVNLLFVYPRWELSRSVWWQHLFPLAALMLLAAAWGVRRRWRGPLAALLVFAVTLFPALGFINVYPFVYSFVADHFQYLASLGVVAAAAAAITAVRGERVTSRRVRGALPLLLLAALGAMTWRQSRNYRDAETLLRATVDGNPSAWMAHTLLGNILAERGDLAQALARHRRAIEIEPGYFGAHNNLGIALAGLVRHEEAVASYRRALGLEPRNVDARYNLGNSLAALGRWEEAIDSYAEYLRSRPDSVEALNNIGNCFAALGRRQEAIRHFGEALARNPDFAEARLNLAKALDREGRGEEAAAHRRRALGIALREGRKDLLEVLRPGAPRGEDRP